MRHINPYKLYELGSKLHGLFNVRAQTRVADMFGPLTDAQNLLDGLIKGDPFPLEFARPEAEKLLQQIGSLFNKYFIDADKQLKLMNNEDRVDSHELSLIQTQLYRFEQVLAAELLRGVQYRPDRLGLYNMNDLAEHATLAFPEGLRKALPQAVQVEFETAARAMAFDLPTAAVIHLLRALDILFLRYGDLYLGSHEGKAERNYNQTLKKLTTMADSDNTAAHPDARVLQMMGDIKDQYRAPLLNPDSKADKEDALALFHLTTSVMTLMLQSLAERHHETQQGKAARLVKGLMADDDDEEETDIRFTQMR
jgi:hypothetical protein